VARAEQGRSAQAVTTYQPRSASTGLGRSTYAVVGTWAADEGAGADRDLVFVRGV